MATYVTDLSTDQAEQIARILDITKGADSITDTPINADRVRIALTAGQVETLTELDAEHDGHVDADGVLWIGGTDYPLKTPHNA